jgi:lambda family phage minor tail protein L
MSTQSFNASLLDLLPDTIIELYELDLGEQDGLFRFHPGIVSASNLIFDGKTYYSLPVDANGFEKKGDGRMPRPTLTVANLDGLMSDILKRRQDLVGHLFIRKRTFLKYIDAANFPNNFNPFAIPDPEARFSDDQFIVNKKSQENKFYVEFELISPLEYEGAKLPARVMIANYCPWKYRGAGCRYGQLTDFDEQKILGLQTAATIFGNNGNLGIPLADDKDKLLFEKNGYNLTSIQFRGDYDKTITNYVKGDVVIMRPAVKILSKIGLSDTLENTDDQCNFFYVCIKDNGSTAKDPRYEKEYWVADQCSKTLNGCKIRFKHYGEYTKGLSFGGFPSIESYRF